MKVFIISVDRFIGSLLLLVLISSMTYNIDWMFFISLDITWDWDKVDNYWLSSLNNWLHFFSVYILIFLN
jgi:hypothetical protein